MPTAWSPGSPVTWADRDALTALAREYGAAVQWDPPEHAS